MITLVTQEFLHNATDSFPREETMIKSPSLKENMWSSLLPEGRIFDHVSSPRGKSMIKSPSLGENLWLSLLP